MQPETKQELEVWGHWEFQNPLHASLCSKLGPRREAEILGSRQPAAPRWWNEIMHYAWKTCSASRPDPARTRPHYTSRCDDKLRHSFVLRPLQRPQLYY